MDWQAISQYGLGTLLIMLYVFKLHPATLAAFRGEMAAEREQCQKNFDTLAAKIDTLISKEK